MRISKLKVPACQSLSTINGSNTMYRLFSVNAAYFNQRLWRAGKCQMKPQAASSKYVLTFVIGILEFL